MHDDLAVLPLTPTLGAEISGIDIRHMDQSRFESLHRCCLKYKDLFSRDQAIGAVCAAPPSAGRLPCQLNPESASLHNLARTR